MPKVIAYDLGTGGIKASLYDEKGVSLASSFIQYETYYPKDRWHEQRPMDWWNGVCKSTQILLEKSNTSAEEITSLALSGHSLVAVPISKDGELLLSQVPIWSDTRAINEADQFFSRISYDDWYLKTGNGFPRECYTVFKLMWMKKNMPEVYKRTYKILGSKDFINYLFTGNIFTDHSYASGTGVYDLEKNDYCDEFIEAAGLSKNIFPEIINSNSKVGRIHRKAALESGLKEGTLVVCGGVDNSCMALGARGLGEGRAYLSLGSSSWIAVTSKKPILDVKRKPYVFTHIDKEYYTSAMSIFSGGNSFRWVRDELCKDLKENEENTYDLMNKIAENVPIGSNGVLFNPSLAGGTSQDKSVNIRGAFMGLSLGNTRDDMIRATMEGIALNLRLSLDGLRKYVPIDKEMLICGGGSKSKLWRQMFADIFNLRIIKTNVDQDAASLGAAAIAATACGIWPDYSIIDQLHQVESIEETVRENNLIYEKLLDIFYEASIALSDLGDMMSEFKRNLQ